MMAKSRCDLGTRIVFSSNRCETHHREVPEMEELEESEESEELEELNDSYKHLQKTGLQQKTELQDMLPLDLVQ